jgi:phosphoribosyl 1,2-cyclic phosphodiesterase
VRLTFLGTRGNIDVRSRRHYRHTATLVSHRGVAVMIDCGTDWLRAVGRIAPDAIVLTHGHPDHVDGLSRGSPCPVYAPAVVWKAIGRWPIRERHRVRSRIATVIHGITFEAYPVAHSLNAPAVGYRITAGAASVFYAPDVLRIPNAVQTLEGISLYIGDGASIDRPIVRVEPRRGQVGHTSIAHQLEWCARAGVARAIFTHCGRGIVAASRDVERRVSDLGRVRHVDARVASDGLQVFVR